jgi:hypothetical protein
MRRPGEAHKKLERLLGNWSGDEKLSPSPWGPGGTAVGRYHHELDLNGFFVVQDYVEEKNGRAVFTGHGIIGYDDKKQAYAWYWVDSTGYVSPSPSYGQWVGDTLTLEGRDDEGKVFSRYTFRMLGPDAFTLRLENSPDGGSSWNTFMEAEYHRS